LGEALVGVWWFKTAKFFSAKVNATAFSKLLRLMALYWLITNKLLDFTRGLAPRYSQ